MSANLCKHITAYWAAPFIIESSDIFVFTHHDYAVSRQLIHKTILKQQITSLTSSNFVISQRNNEAATRLLKIQAAIQKKGPKQNLGPFSHFIALST
jgi:hypothetical protein